MAEPRAATPRTTRYSRLSAKAKARPRIPRLSGSAPGRLHRHARFAGRRRPERAKISGSTGVSCRRASHTSIGGARRATIISMVRGTRMGSLAYDLAVGRPFAIDGLTSALGVEQARPRPRRVFRARDILVQGGERVGIPELCVDREPDIIEKWRRRSFTSRRACELAAEFSRRRRSRNAPAPTFWSPVRPSSAASSGPTWRRMARAVMSCRWSTRRKRLFPIRRIGFVESEGLGSVTAGRAETWRNDYRTLLANHRAACARSASNSAGASPSIAPMRPTELLFAIQTRAWVPARS